jgi:ketosteroid isomerase-like protein
MTHSPTAVTAAYVAAVYAKDKAALLALHDPEIAEFDMWGDWQRAGLDSLAASVDDWFGGLGSERVVVVFDLTRATEMGDMALIEAIVTFKAEAEDGSILRQLDNRLTWGLRRGPAGWRILHQHTSCPIDPKTGGVIWSRGRE